MKKIALFTSGGDSPGMNACIRAVVRTAICHQVEIVGILQGYEGMIDGDFINLDAHSVSNIIQRGGTILKTARSQRFMTAEGRIFAKQQLEDNGIEGIVAIGGDGTFTGANVFSEICSIPFIGIPGTIDNDLFGTDYTLGFDTATNTALEAIDRIRDTATSHNRIFFVEVMGRDAGFIALHTGLAGGAEAVLVPETDTNLDQLLQKLETGWSRHKSSMIIVVAEGDEKGGAFEIAKVVRQRFNHLDIRVTVLGHIQRGGNPTCADRILASRLGAASVEALLSGRRNEMAGIINNELVFTRFDKATKQHGQLNTNLLRLVELLSV